jgi:predicted nucleic acid-binding protein
MEAFFDSSAIVPLLIEESGSARACELWSRTETAWAWEWGRVETEAALARRGVGPEAWAHWRRLAGAVSFLKLEEPVSAVCDFNRLLGLRAADAGHVFVAERLFRVQPELILVTLDVEMRAAAGRLGLRVAG